MQMTAVKREYWCSQKIVTVGDYLLGSVGIPETHIFCLALPCLQWRQEHHATQLLCRQYHHLMINISPFKQ